MCLRSVSCARLLKRMRHTHWMRLVTSVTCAASTSPTLFSMITSAQAICLNATQSSDQQDVRVEEALRQLTSPIPAARR